MKGPVVATAVYAAWEIGRALGHLWALIDWDVIAAAIAPCRSLSAAAKRIHNLAVDQLSQHDRLGLGIYAPTARGGRFQHVTTTGRSQFVVAPLDKLGTWVEVRQTVGRPDGRTAVDAGWIVEGVGQQFQPWYVDVFPAARRRHIEALLFEGPNLWELRDDTETPGDLVDYEEVVARLKSRELQDVADAAEQLDAVCRHAGIDIGKLLAHMRADFIADGRFGLEAEIAARELATS